MPLFCTDYENLKKRGFIMSILESTEGIKSIFLRLEEESPKQKLVSIKDNSETLLSERCDIEGTYDTFCRQAILSMILWAKGKKPINDLEQMNFVCDCLGLIPCNIAFVIPSPQEFIVLEDATPEEIAEVKKFIGEFQHCILGNEDYLKAQIFGDEKIVVSMLRHNIARYFDGELNTKYVRDMIVDYYIEANVRHDNYIIDTLRKLDALCQSN